MELLKVIVEIWVLLVITIIIIVELEKGWKNSAKLISTTKKDATLTEGILETKIKILGINNNQELIDKIAENIISLEWTGNKQYHAISYLVEQKHILNSRQLDLIFTNTTGYYSENTPLAFLFANKGYVFSIDTLLKHNNPVCGHGWSLAHEMANQNHMFSVEELELLGNPADNRGLTISDIMMLNGHQFSEVEKHKLGIDYQDFSYTAYATYPEDIYQTYDRKDLSKTCIKCGGEFSSTDLPNVVHNDRGYYSLKLYSCSDCHWWILHEEWMENNCDYRCFSVLFVGVPKLYQPDTVKDQKPWEKFLPEKLVYHHRLKDNNEILSLFPTEKEHVNQPD